MNFDNPETFVIFLMVAPVAIPLAMGAAWWLLRRLALAWWRWSQSASEHT